MELDGRPLLLSPVLPRLPGFAQTPTAEAEPPLRASDFAPRPLPLECKPLPAEVQQRLASGEGLLVALAAYSRHSQLAWCQQQVEQEQQRAEREQQAAPPPPEQRQQQQHLAERPARAVKPAALPAAPAASAAAGEEAGSDSLGGAPSEPLPRPCSRASAAAAQEGPPLEPGVGQPEAGDEDDGTAGLLEAEAVGGDEDMLDAGEGSPRMAPPPPPAAAAPESAAGAPPAESLAPQPAGAGPARGASTRRRAACRQATGAAGQHIATGAAAAMTAAEAGEPAGGGEAQEGAAAAAAAHSPAEAAAMARHAAVEAPAGAEAAAAGADEHVSDDDEELEGQDGGEGQQGRKRPLSAQEAATEAALQKIGQPSWELLCKELRRRAQQAQQAGEAQQAQQAQQAGEAGGRGGRGRGRRGGRRGGRGGAAAKQTIRLTDVLNPNSPVYHAEFAAAYHGAKDSLSKNDVKRQKNQALKEHSKLVGRWSDLSAKEHEWFLRHQGQALVGSEAQRMALLQGRVAAEQQRYWQEIQQRAAGGAAAQRYQHASARQLAQLEDDAAQRRQRVARHQPRLFHLRAVLPVDAAPPAPAAGDQPSTELPAPELRHVAALRQDGEAPLFAAPPSGAKLLGDRLYLPCTVPAGGAGAAGGAAVRAYRKAAVPPLADDPLVLEVALEALSQRQAMQQQAQGQEAEQAEQQAEQRQEQEPEQQLDQPVGDVAAPAHNQQQGQQPAAATSEQHQQAAAVGSEQQQQQQPLFCLAGSAFAAIVCTPMLQRRPAWEIPITICQLPAGAAEQGSDAAGDVEAGGTSSGGPATIVCIDKPLQQRVLTMRAKQQRLQKYAVLSLAASSQQPQQAQPHGATGQADEDAQQGPAPTRRSARSTRSTAAAEEAAAARGAEALKRVGAPGAVPAALPPREASYDCWQLGGSRLLLRTHGRMLLAPAATEGGSAQPGGESAGQQEGRQGGQAQQAEEPAQQAQQGGQVQQAQQAAEQAQQAAEQAQQAQHVLLALKTEYLPEEESEEFTVDELCRWWLRLLVCPTADALVAAHVHVPHSKVLSWQTLTAGDLERHCSGAGEDEGGDAAAQHMRRLAGAGLALLQQLLGALGALGPGRYLLAHAPGEPTCCLFKALPAEAAEAVQGHPPPLPCSATLAQPGTIYDLHAAHQRSGATDTETPCFVPPRWRPFHPDYPQIPYTFPPKLGLGQLGKQQRYKKRQRNVLPHAWKVLGEGGDFDQVHHIAQINRGDYYTGLEEELE